jgi:hypothetical protein
MKTTITIPGLLGEAFTDISAMSIHDTCDGDACWFTAGEAFLYYLGTYLIWKSQISDYSRDPLLLLNVVRTIMWSLQIPLYMVGLGLWWMQKRRKRRKRRTVMRAKNAFAKDCATFDVEILRKQISVHKKIVALETLVWILLGIG